VIASSDFPLQDVSNAKFRVREWEVRVQVEGFLGFGGCQVMSPKPVVRHGEFVPVRSAERVKFLAAPDRVKSFLEMATRRQTEAEKRQSRRLRVRTGAASQFLFG
jgi:hypothetical protein